MKLLRPLICSALAFIFLVSCAPTAPTITPQPGLTGTLRPYPSDTPTSSPYPTDYVTATLTPTITPTGTPVYYAVKGDDDMFGIALRYGISLEALKTANPTVSPNYMGEGLTLLIPITPTVGATPAATAETGPTPAPTGQIVASLQTDCYRDGAGGVYCFVLVPNESGKPLENVSAVVTLTGTQTDYSLSQTAILPLNILPAQQTLPLITYFQPPTPQKFSASAVIDFSLPVPEGDTRYLEAAISNPTTAIVKDGLSARVSGEVQLTDPTKPASSVWVLAVAYAQDGQVAGLRRWEAQPPIAIGEPIPFSTSVYSLGTTIERLELFVEVRPILP